jgi:hypothetical protein
VRPFDGIEPSGWVPTSLLSWDPLPRAATPLAAGAEPAPGAAPAPAPGATPAPAVASTAAPGAATAPAATPAPAVASTAAPKPASATATSAKPVTSTAAGPEPRWGFRILAGGGGLGPSDLDVEYSDGGYRADVQYLRLLKKQWMSGFGVGYRNFAGHPPGAYMTATTLDDPHESTLQAIEIGARAGQRYGDRSGFRFDWMLGPTLAHVHESAKMSVYAVVTPDSLEFIGYRDDALGRWAGGGEVRANLGWGDRSGNEWGLHFGAFMFAWEGHEEHSLATDFIRSNIHGWDISLSYSILR